MGISPDARPVTSAPSPAIEEVDTNALVTRAMDNDQEAFAMLFHRFHDEIYRFATRRLGDSHRGQDVAAETFASAFASLPRFRWKGVPFEAWLYTIARRRVIDAQRSIKPVTSLEGAAEALSTPDPSEAAADALQVRGLLDLLNETDRVVLELRFMEDLDVEQTALRMDKSAGAIRVAQHRAMNRLRELSQEGVA